MSQNKTKEENKSLPTAEEILRKNVPTITFDKLIGTPIGQVLKSMEEYASQYRNLHNDAGTKLLKKLLDRKDEVNENGFCVVEYVERNGSATTYLRHDAVVKELNNTKK